MDRCEVLKYFENAKSFYESTVEDNIEKYRKGSCKVTILDNSGLPVAGARVKIKQKNHAFRFGANIFMLDELETNEKNLLYKERFKDVFNMATLPFYWDSVEPKKGEYRFDKDCSKYYRRPSIDLCMEFCQENGIEPREHALAYDNHFPDWLVGASVDTVKKELEKRFEMIAKRYGDKINTI